MSRDVTLSCVGAFCKIYKLLIYLISGYKTRRSVVSFTHKQNIIISQTQLDDIAHEQTIICRQLFASHVVGSQPL